MSNPIRVSIDDRQVMAALKKGSLDVTDMLEIEKAPALVIVNKQKELVPVDTAATKLSIGQHVQKATATSVEDDIGPETDYAPYIEFGVASKPNYPIQPFVRPSGEGQRAAIEHAASAAFKAKVNQKYGGT